MLKNTYTIFAKNEMPNLNPTDKAAFRKVATWLVVSAVAFVTALLQTGKVRVLGTSERRDDLGAAVAALDRSARAGL